MVVQLLFYAAVIVIGTALVWYGSERLEHVSERLAAHYRLPPVVQGAVIAAVGSSMPELSSTILSTVGHGEFDLGVSVVVGSAIFNVLVIPGLSGLASGGMVAKRRFLYKDALFYISAVLVLLLAFSFAIIYHPHPDDRLTGDLDRLIAAMPVLLYGLYLFIQQQDTLEKREAHLEASITRERSEAFDVDVGRQWAILGVSLLLILAGVEGLVRSAIGLGDLFGTPSFLWGLTIIAGVTSLPDAFISVRAARRGQATVSLANVLGSNIFDLLIAVPAGVFVAGAAAVDFTVAAPMMGFLMLATVALFTVLRTDLRLTLAEAWTLLACYTAFVTVMVLETFGVTNVMR